MTYLAKQALFLDWLTIYGRCRLLHITPQQGVSEMPTHIGNYTISTPKRSLHFNNVAPISRKVDGRNLAIGTLCWHPATPIMHPTTCSVKFDNALLYRADYYSQIIDLLRALQLDMVTITRIDLALDFIDMQVPHNEVVSGDELIRRFVDGRYVRKGSRKFAIHGTSSRRIKDDALIVGDRAGYESITFGTHASVSQWTLYNKTQELRAHSLGGYCPKEYIRDGWKEAGCYSPQRDTWRIEVRITGRANTLVNHATGEVEPLTLLALEPARLLNTARAVFAKWSIIYDTQLATASSTTHISRLERVQLLSSEATDVSILRIIPKRVGLPNAKYIKGVLTTMRSIAIEHADLLSDYTDAYIISDARRAMVTIYNAARAADRERELQRMRAEVGKSILDLLSFEPRLSDAEEHLYSYLRVTHQV